MFEIRVLSKEATEDVLEMKQVIKAVEAVYRAKAEGKSEVFPLIFYEFEPGVADFDIKSGWLKDSGIWGLKVVSWFGNNPAKGLPALIGTILVLDAETGAPTGLVDGTHITGMRTGAAGAIGAKYLARSDSKKLLMVGAGHISTFEIAASLILLPGLEEVVIYDALDADNAAKLAASIRGTITDVFSIDVSDRVIFRAAEDITADTKASDIIITATPAREPVIMREWVSPGTHFSCIGADMSGKEEIDPKIFENARVFTDDTPQCAKVGEIEIPIAHGVITQDDVAGEIGEIITGETKGRESDEQITVFDATGTALLDLLTARLALTAAAEKGIGTVVEV
jgi:ornithine cyclodeaminase/alanine dehydrogenase